MHLGSDQSGIAWGDEGERKHLELKPELKYRRIKESGRSIWNALNTSEEASCCEIFLWYFSEELSVNLPINNWSERRRLRFHLPPVSHTRRCLWANMLPVTRYYLQKEDREIDFKSAGRAWRVWDSGPNVHVFTTEECAASRESGTQHGRPDYQSVQIKKRKENWANARSGGTKISSYWIVNAAFVRQNIKLIKGVKLLKVQARTFTVAVFWWATALRRSSTCTCSLNALGRRRRCIFHFPIAESKRRGREGENTFLLCCVLYGRQEYPSFYCTLIYYNETGNKAGRASGWCLHRSARCQTFSNVAALRHRHARLRLF